MTRKNLAAHVLTLVGLVLSLIGPMVAVPDQVAQAQQLEGFSILLGRPTDHSITVNVIPDQSGEISFEYGTAPGVYGYQTTATPCTADVPVEVVIDGLTSDTPYYYRLCFRATSGDPWTAGGEHSFHTQRPPGSTFTFTIISDSHLGQYGGQTANQKALYQLTLLNVLADQPDFHLDLGDTFPMDPSPLGTGMTDAEAKAAYLYQRPYLDTISASTPFYLALGNHENEEGWNWDDVFTAPDNALPLVGIKYRKLYYPNPIPDDFYSGNTDPLPQPIGGDSMREDYYAWTWGDALFVVLDPFQYTMIWPSEGSSYGGEGMDGEAQGDRWDWTLGHQQYEWLKSTLENSDAKWKFVFTHHLTGGVIPYGRGGVGAAPYFEWGGLNWDGTDGFATERPGWEMPIHDLLVANGVNILFHGHDHFFSKEELDGIVYLEVPKPDDNTNATDYRQDGGGYPTGDNLDSPGHIRVMISPAQVTVDYVRAYLPGQGTNGEVAYSFTLLAEGPTTHDLTMAVDPAEGGTTDPTVGVHPYPEDEIVTITATAAEGYAFDHWEGVVANPSAASTTVTMDGDKSVTAHFVPEAAGISGDPSGDDAVNSTDALIILSCDVGTDTSQYCPMNCGDVNADGLVNSTDALIVLSYDVGMTVLYPVGEAGCPSSVASCPGCTP
jgi:hypothetical protein